MRNQSGNSNNLGNKIPYETYWQDQLVCTKVQAQNKIKSGPDAYNESRLWPFQLELHGYFVVSNYF